jgi:hypothetical protein
MRTNHPIEEDLAIGQRQKEGRFYRGILRTRIDIPGTMT